MIEAKSVFALRVENAFVLSFLYLLPFSLEDETYIYSGFTENGSASRVILQALMLNNEVPPTLQVENILENINKGKVILESEFQEEKTKLLSQENSSRSDIKTLYNALVSKIDAIKERKIYYGALVFIAISLSVLDKYNPSLSNSNLIQFNIGLIFLLEIPFIT